MKYCKHYLLFALAGALLLLPVTSHYAISWDEIKRKARTFVSEDNAKIMPSAVVVAGLAAGGLYYWLMSRGITKPISFEIKGRQVTQFPVYSQFWWYGEGAASCGYHMLLRSMQVVQAKAYEESDNDLEKTLTSYSVIAGYFGQNGSWREKIIQRRQKDGGLGDWLQADELEYLWNEQESDIIAQDVFCDFIAIDDFSRIDPYGGYSLEGLRELKEGEIALDKMVWDIQRKLQSMVTVKGRSYCHIFGIGDRYDQAKKHWFALILYQDPHGHREYFLVDSKNVLRRNDERVKNLITAIESPIGTESI